VRGRRATDGRRGPTDDGNGHESMPVAGCGGVRPVVDGAHRLGHRRRPILRSVSPSDTRSGIAVQGGFLPLLSWVPCESSPTCSHPVGRSRRNVPFLTGQKGDEKSRRAGRATADGSAPRRGRKSQLARTSAMASLRHRFATRPSAAQRSPRRRTAKSPEKNRRKKERKVVERYRSFFERLGNESRSREDLNPGRRLSHRSSIL